MCPPEVCIRTRQLYLSHTKKPPIDHRSGFPRSGMAVGRNFPRVMHHGQCRMGLFSLFPSGRMAWADQLYNPHGDAHPFHDPSLCSKVPTPFPFLTLRRPNYHRKPDIPSSSEQPKFVITRRFPIRRYRCSEHKKRLNFMR